MSTVDAKGLPSSPAETLMLDHEQEVRRALPPVRARPFARCSCSAPCKSRATRDLTGLTSGGPSASSARCASLARRCLPAAGRMNQFASFVARCHRAAEATQLRPRPGFHQATRLRPRQKLAMKRGRAMSPMLTRAPPRKPLRRGLFHSTGTASANPPRMSAAPDTRNAMFQVNSFARGCTGCSPKGARRSRSPVPVTISSSDTPSSSAP